MKHSVAVDKVQVKFGAHQVLHEISFDVKPGEIVGIIGPNGCGKTTLLNTLSGIVSASGGSVFLQEEDVTKLKHFERARFHIGRSFQNTGVFKEMTVEENLMMVIEREEEFPLWWMFQGASRRHMSKRIDELLETVGLKEHKKSLAGILSGGQLRLLELLKLQVMQRPILLIDEPTAGVAPVLRNKLGEMIKDLSKEHGRTVIIVEHDLKFLFDMVDRVIVLVDGKVFMEGDPKEVQSSPKLKEVYFGS